MGREGAHRALPGGKLPGKCRPRPKTPDRRIPHPAVVGGVVDDDPLGPKRIQKIRVDLEKAPLARKALHGVAVDARCAGLYTAGWFDQRVEEGLSPAGEDADLDEVYGVAKACGLRVKDYEVSLQEKGACPPDSVLAAAYWRGRNLPSCDAQATHPASIFARRECQGYSGGLWSGLGQEDENLSG